MCRLVGFVDRHGDSAEELTDRIGTMTETLLHRGPDDGGTWLDLEAGLALGSRRLAIIDLSEHGHQPMASADGRFVIAYNGELYNHRSLRRSLEATGHRFRSHSDTEVLLSSVTEWGVRGALERFVGMFAFALWDSKERTFSLARDRMGEKPLYYGWTAGSSVRFGAEGPSSPSSILRVPGPGRAGAVLPAQVHPGTVFRVLAASGSSSPARSPRSTGLTGLRPSRSRTGTGERKRPGRSPRRSGEVSRTRSNDSTSCCPLRSVIGSSPMCQSELSSLEEPTRLPSSR